MIAVRGRLALWASIGLVAALPQAAAAEGTGRDAAASQSGRNLFISEQDLYDRIYGFWLGQLVGNIYGLPHENIHIDEPGPDAFPYGYDFLEIPYYRAHFGATRMTGVMDAFGGAFSDDDTDIEYIYLQLMEDVGIEPSYADIRAAWMAHVDDWVWIANRQALALMHQGYYPPDTGSRALNSEWFQIDPQLINEIWAVTAPGMVDYAAAKSAWAAKVSADGWGTEPTIAYGAMFAAAFRETDPGKLVDIGAAALSPDAKFAGTIAFVKALHERYPDDWRAARRELAGVYYHGDPSRSIWNANLNGACAILAFLYGKGDFQKTMDLASAMGFDADNQAATLGGLLGVMHGAEAIPRDLLYPVKGWALPFNDRYLNRSRRDMPSTSISDMARRTAALAGRVIVARGGQRIVKDGRAFYRIDSRAGFSPPFELPAMPERTLVLGKPVMLRLHAGGAPAEWSAAGVPEGLVLQPDGAITGIPTRSGDFRLRVTARNGHRKLESELKLAVLGPNLATEAWRVLGPAATDLDALRDGIGEGGRTVSSPKTATRPESFGYEWAKPVTIGAVLVTTGRMEEGGGWFTSLSAEYQDENGDWIAIPHLRMMPEPVLHNDKHLQSHYASYALRFPQIRARAVRIKGLNGGVDGQRFVSLSELAVFP